MTEVYQPAIVIPGYEFAPAQKQAGEVLRHWSITFQVSTRVHQRSHVSAPLVPFNEQS